MGTPPLVPTVFSTPVVGNVPTAPFGPLGYDAANNVQRQISVDANGFQNVVATVQVALASQQVTILGWDSTSNQLRQVLVDSSGRLQTTALGYDSTNNAERPLSIDGTSQLRVTGPVTLLGTPAVSVSSAVFDGVNRLLVSTQASIQTQVIGTVAVSIASSVAVTGSFAVALASQQVTILGWDSAGGGLLRQVLVDQSGRLQTTALGFDSTNNAQRPLSIDTSSRLNVTGPVTITGVPQVSVASSVFDANTRLLVSTQGSTGSFDGANRLLVSTQGSTGLFDASARLLVSTQASILTQFITPPAVSLTSANYDTNSRLLVSIQNSTGVYDTNSRLLVSTQGSTGSFDGANRLLVSTQGSTGLFDASARLLVSTQGSTGAFDPNGRLLVSTPSSVLVQFSVPPQISLTSAVFDANTRLLVSTQASILTQFITPPAVSLTSANYDTSARLLVSTQASILTQFITPPAVSLTSANYDASSRLLVSTQSSQTVTVFAIASGITNLSVANLGSGSQTFAATATRRYLNIFNNTALNVGLSFVAAATASARVGTAGTITLPTNQTFTFGPAYVYSGQYTICGTSGGGGITVIEGSAPGP